MLKKSTVMSGLSQSVGDDVAADDRTAQEIWADTHLEVADREHITSLVWISWCRIGSRGFERVATENRVTRIELGVEFKRNVRNHAR